MVASQALEDVRIIVAVDTGEAIKHSHADDTLIAFLTALRAVNAVVFGACRASAHLEIGRIIQVIAVPVFDNILADDENEDDHDDRHDG